MNSQNQNSKPIKLTPSLLTEYHYNQQCPACLWAALNGWKKPRTPFPSVFGVMDNLQRKYWDGKCVSLLDGSLCGIVSTKKARLKSNVMMASNIPFYISCELDAFFDRGRAWGVMDFKTSSADDVKLQETYWHQLHMNALAIENQAPQKSGMFSLEPRNVDVFGLAVYCPIELTSGQSMTMGQRWLRIERNDALFFDYIGKILTIASSPSEPVGVEKCQTCRIRHGEHALAILNNQTSC